MSGTGPSGGRAALWRRALARGEPESLRDRPDRVQPSRDRSAADWLVNSALFAFAAGLGGLALGGLWYSHGEILDDLDLAAGVLACMALWARRGRPTAVLVVVAATAFFSPLALGAALVAIGTAAAHARRRRDLLVVGLLTVAGSVIFPLVNPAGGELIQAVFPAFLPGLVAVGLGLFVRARHELVASLRERAERLEADRQRSIELAREGERRRIAREMHDVLAHRLSLLSLHAGALEFRPDAPAGEVARAAAVIRTAAAAALSDLREVITVLREEPDDAAGPPQPDLGQLPDLLEESRRAGMTLRARIDLPAAGSLPPALGRTVYRVVQEGLTNARRHAPGAAVEVTVATGGPTAFMAEVISRPPAARPAPAAAHAREEAGAGAGLIGLAERLALVGGELEHGRNPAGDFVLRAIVPRAS
jgi:signal transduction histidine kinase